MKFLGSPSTLFSSCCCCFFGVLPEACYSAVEGLFFSHFFFSPSGRDIYDWAVYKLSGILGSVGHRVKIHKMTPAQGKERGDLEIRDYVVL
jgi:hypothetical protein